MTFLPNIAKLLYQLIEVASTMCIGEIVNSASLLQTTRLLDKVLSELRCISETQSNLFYKVTFCAIVLSFYISTDISGLAKYKTSSS